MASGRIRFQNEKMAADLQQWASDKLFSMPEVKMIAKKKTNFEYIISAPSSEVVDFLRYIKFETDVEKLLQTRLKKNKKNRDNNYCNGINLIFHRATNRFQDKNLFILYINFCLQRKLYVTAKSVFTRGLRIFATEPEIWIMASNFEYDINHNITAARVLLQMALRFNPTSEHIWTTFFAIELKYWAEIMRRKAENLKPLKADTENSVTVDGQEPMDPLFASDTPFADCAIPRLVYASAIKSLPQNYQFRAQFLEIARKFLDTDELIKSIATDISEAFPLNGQALSVHADLQLRFSGNLNKQSYVDACEVFEKALEKTKSSEVWEHYIKYIRDKLASLSMAHAQLVTYLTSKLFEACEKAPPSPATYLTWVDALISTGRGEEANKLVNRSIKKFPKNPALRLQKIEILIKSSQPKGKILNAFERAVKKADGNAELWYRYVQWMALNEVFDASTQLTAAELDEELETTQPDQAMVSVCTRCLKSLFNIIPEADYNTLKINLYNTIFFQFGILAARKFLEQALKTPPHSLAFCTHALAIEEAQPKAVFAPQVVRQVYEAVVREHGAEAKCEDVWLRYVKFEQSQAQITRAGDIYWRAKKTLKDTASFMAKYEQIKQ